MRAAAAAVAAVGARAMGRQCRRRPRPSSWGGGGGGFTARGLVTIHGPRIGGGVRERPTPLLLLQGEGLGAECWAPLVGFFTRRGCTMGTIDDLHSVQFPPPPSAAASSVIKAYESRLVAAAKRIGMGPPVLVAHGLMGFVAQKYLESHAAAGVVLLDSLPPSPGPVIERYLAAISAGAKRAEQQQQQQPHHPPIDATVLRRLLSQATPSLLGPSATIDPALFPLEALREAAAPASAMRLEPQSTEFLLLHSRGHPFIGAEEVAATAAFHAIDPADVRELVAGFSADDAGGERGEQLAEAIYSGWYDDRF